MPEANEETWSLLAKKRSRYEMLVDRVKCNQCGRHVVVAPDEDICPGCGTDGGLMDLFNEGIEG